MKPHTPGPWAVVSTDAAGQSEFYILPGGDSPAIASGLLGCGRRVEEAEANARLIAAAPELLANLEFAVKLLSGMPGISGSAQVDHMRAVISKATGAAVDGRTENAR